MSEAGAAAREISAAVALLTRVPVAAFAESTGAAAFGIVGAAIGVVSAVVVVLASVAGAPAAAVVGIGCLALVSGGLHLDGLADTADALAAPDPERAETARLDPRPGAVGVVTLVLVLSLDVALLGEVMTDSLAMGGITLIVATAASRAFAAVTPVIARGRVRGARSGEWFARRTPGIASGIAMGSAVGIALVAGALARNVVAIGVPAGLAITAAVAEWLIRRRRGLDGDLIGATVEIAFTTILLITVALERGT